MSKTLVLLSGCSREEYFIGSLETIALPQGFIQHYRYDKKLINRDFVFKKLQEEPSLSENVIICIVIQEKVNDEYKWGKIIPVRKAILKDSNLSLHNQPSFHFHFELKELVFPNPTFDSIIQTHFTDEYGKKYVHVLNDDNFLQKNVNSVQCLQRLNDLISEEKFEHSQGEYSKPLLFHIKNLNYRGIRSIKNAIPKYDGLNKKSHFVMKEGTIYTLEYIATVKEDNLTYSIKISTDPKCFSTPQERIIEISAEYDNDWIDFLPSLIDRNIRSIINIDISEKNAVVDSTKKNLVVQLPLPVSIKIRSVRFISEILGDIFLALATLTIAAQKAFENTGWPSILLFSWEQYLIFFIVFALLSRILKFAWKK